MMGDHHSVDGAAAASAQQHAVSWPSLLSVTELHFIGGLHHQPHPRPPLACFLCASWVSPKATPCVRTEMARSCLKWPRMIRSVCFCTSRPWLGGTPFQITISVNMNQPVISSVTSELCAPTRHMEHAWPSLTPPLSRALTLTQGRRCRHHPRRLLPSTRELLTGCDSRKLPYPRQRPTVLAPRWNAGGTCNGAGSPTLEAGSTQRCDGHSSL